LVLPGTEQYSGLELHEVMQSKHPFEYISYAIMDVVGMQDLELKTNDLSQALPVQAGFTDFSRFNSQTKRFADDFTFFLLDAQCVVGTIPPRKKEEEIEVDLDEPPSEDDDEEGTGDDDDSIVNEDGDVLVPRVEVKPEDSVVLSLKRWIVTLASHLTVLGQFLIKECKTLRTLIRLMVYDSDAVGAYPSAAMVANVSRETTVRELIDIEGIEEDTFRRHNLNLLQGHVNALEYGNVMHGLPTPQEALKYFDDL